MAAVIGERTCPGRRTCRLWLSGERWNVTSPSLGTSDKQIIMKLNQFRNAGWTAEAGVSLAEQMARSAEV